MAQRKRKVPFILQHDRRDCGLTCVEMIGRSYNRNFFLDRNRIGYKYGSKAGFSVVEINDIAKKNGFDVVLSEVKKEHINSFLPLPCILYWKESHYVVLENVKNETYYILDPSLGRISYNNKELSSCFFNDAGKGVLLLLEPNEEFKFSESSQGLTKKNYGFTILRRYKKELGFIITTLIISTIIDLLLPFYSREVMDKGVKFENIPLIYIYSISNFVLLASRISIEFFRTWMFIHLSSRISISLISNFLIKLLHLPIGFFNTKSLGDISQRVEDHNRIEQFLTTSLVHFVFAVFTLFTCMLILIYFNITIAIVVLFTFVVEIVWIFRYLHKMKVNDFKYFTYSSDDESFMIETISSVQEIKLNNIEELIIDDWQRLQKKIFLNKLERTKLSQKYEGYKFFTAFRTVFVLMIAAWSIVNNTMSVGTMLSISLVIGNMDYPITKIINFLLNYSLVRVSFDRMNEVHLLDSEPECIQRNVGIEDIVIRNLSFGYKNNQKILRSVNLTIPKKQVTAIVGSSGTGKTTLIKILLGLLERDEGDFYIGNLQFDQIDNKYWRNRCGAVLQDSFIFNRSIEFNITMGKPFNQAVFNQTCELANVSAMINEFPQKEKTIIGKSGSGLSEGQKQRIFIARAIYKNPDYLFFDEATNSLDTENELEINKNIYKLFKNKTLVIVAHRLSTIRNADNIIVFDNGKIVESGTHEELLLNSGRYSELVINQL